MKLRRYSSAAAFLDAARAFLLAAEAENNLILGIAGDLAQGHVSSAAPYFATVHGQGEIRVCAFSSIPEKVGLTRAIDPAVLPLLAADIAAACPEVQVATAPEATAGTFSGQLAARRGTMPRLWMSQRIHELRSVEPLPDLPGGRLRPAELNDRDILTGWVADFMADVGDDGDATEIARDRISRGLLHVWEYGEIVSMAGWTGKTPNGVRIVLVYRHLRSAGEATRPPAWRP